MFFSVKPGLSAAVQAVLPRKHSPICGLRDLLRMTCLCLLLAAGINFDVEAFKHELQRLAMPHQHFSFSQVCQGWQLHAGVSCHFDTHPCAVVSNQNGMYMLRVHTLQDVDTLGAWFSTNHMKEERTGMFTCEWVCLSPP